MTSLSVEILGDSNPLAVHLNRDLRDARAASVAVAFAKESGLREVDLEGWCRDGRDLRLLAGTDFAITELDLLKRMERLATARCRLHHALGKRSFHPKLYVLDKPDSCVVYVGSSNFTAGGLRTNVEANVRLEGPSDSPEIAAAAQTFISLFESEFATPLTSEFEARYRELQAARQQALRGEGLTRSTSHVELAERLLVGAHRSGVAAKRWLLVVVPENYAICMRSQTWGKQREAEIRPYSPGDVFFFHVTQGRGTTALGMFTGLPYLDESPLWQKMNRGSFPWRIRFVILGELRTSIPTREILEPLRPGAPKNWYQGFIQASHSLSPDDFEALRRAFEAAVREENLAHG